jgi:hypothetical protein
VVGYTLNEANGDISKELLLGISIIYIAIFFAATLTLSFGKCLPIEAKRISENYISRIFYVNQTLLILADN